MLQGLTNLTELFVRGFTRVIQKTVCVEGMHKSCAALTLHMGVLTKTFAMSVLYLKSELNCGSGAINGEDASKAGGHGSQRARFLMSLRGVRFSVSLHIGVQLACPFSQALKHLSARHLLAIKRVRRGVM